jgi:hypothetical protein
MEPSQAILNFKNIEKTKTNPNENQNPDIGQAQRV